MAAASARSTAGEYPALQETYVASATGLTAVDVSELAENNVFEDIGPDSCFKMEPYVGAIKRAEERSYFPLWADVAREVQFAGLEAFLCDDAGKQLPLASTKTKLLLARDKIDAQAIFKKALKSWLVAKGVDASDADSHIAWLEKNYVQPVSGMGNTALPGALHGLLTNFPSKTAYINFDPSEGGGWVIDSVVKGPITIFDMDKPDQKHVGFLDYHVVVRLVSVPEPAGFRLSEVLASKDSQALMFKAAKLGPELKDEFERAMAESRDSKQFDQVKQMIGDVLAESDTWEPLVQRFGEKFVVAYVSAKAHAGLHATHIHAVADAALAEAKIIGPGRPGISALADAVCEANLLAYSRSTRGYGKATRAVAHRSGLYTAMTVLGVAVLATAAAAGVVALTAATGGAGGVAAIALAATFHSTVAAWACAVGGVLGLGAMVGVGVARRRAGLRTWGMTEGVTSVAMREFGKAKAAQGATATAFRRERVVPVEVSAAASIAGAAAAASAVGVTPAE